VITVKQNKIQNRMKNIILTISILCFSSVNAQLIKEVKIGNQIWMSENLNVVSFRNGDLIKQARNQEEWERLNTEKKPGWCFYAYDYKDAPKYGKLYNYYAVSDPRGLAPQGWHIPSNEEWDRLINSIQSTARGGENIPNIVGKRMKSTNEWCDFHDKLANGDNVSGFNGYPGGYHDPTGIISALGIEKKGQYGFWWSSTIKKGNINDVSNCKIWIRSLHYKNDNIGKNSCDPRYALSVRCVKDGGANESIDSLALVKLLNIESKRIQEENKAQKIKFDLALKSTSTSKEAKFNELVSKYYNVYQNDPRLAIEILNRLIKLMPVNKSSINKINQEWASLHYLYYNSARLKTIELKDYNGAISDARRCLELKSLSDNPIYDRQQNLRLLQAIYEEMGDIETAFFWKIEGNKNSIAAYNEAHNLLEKSNQEFAGMQVDYKYYCFTNINGRYQLGLDDGGAHNVTYQQYNLSGSLIKSLVGKWKLQDEGVYGPAMTLTISFTGKNSGLPSMKYIAQYDGFGNLQGVIDNQGRIWGVCR
jgi:uncharacterized protein (TIGR02145 family)